MTPGGRRRPPARRASGSSPGTGGPAAQARTPAPQGPAAPAPRPPSAAAIDRALGALAGRYPPTMLGAFAGRLPPFQILIGTILSARSRDEVTDRVCAALFARYATPERLAAARPAAVIPLLRVMGFYRQKAKFIIGTARLLLARHGGAVPRTLDELTALPGVGRKVANCVLVYAFGVPAIPVDTHVHRIANRLGWVRTRTPEETERALAAFLPRRHWLTINDLLVGHGKSICRPVGPRCGECPIAGACALGRSRTAGTT